MPEKSLVDMLSELAPSILTGIMTLSGIAYANWHNSKMVNAEGKKELSRRKLDKLEELYFIVSKYKAHIFKTSLLYLAFHNEKITQQALAELLSKNNTEKKFDITNVEVIVDLYFPELMGPYGDLNNAWNQIFSSWGIDGKVDKKLLPKIVANEESFGRQCTVFLSALSKVARNL